MNSKQVVNVLAVLGAVVVMIGVMFAATSALADEHFTVTTTAAPIHDAADASLDNASRAHLDAAEDAAARIAMSNRLDLDIRFFDHKSVSVAGNR